MTTPRSPIRNYAVKLHENTGETSSYIEAQIKSNGDLVLSGQDCGKAPLEFWGELDYEYWLTVLSAHKARVLKALIEHCKETGAAASSLSGNQDKAILELLQQLYGGHPSAFEEIHELLKANDIPAQFFSYA